MTRWHDDKWQGDKHNSQFTASMRCVCVCICSNSKYIHIILSNKKYYTILSLSCLSSLSLSSTVYYCSRLVGIILYIILLHSHHRIHGRIDRRHSLLYVGVAFVVGVLFDVVSSVQLVVSHCLNQSRQTTHLIGQACLPFRPSASWIRLAASVPESACLFSVVRFHWFANLLRWWTCCCKSEPGFLWDIAGRRFAHLHTCFVLWSPWWWTSTKFCCSSSGGTWSGLCWLLLPLLFELSS